MNLVFADQAKNLSTVAELYKKTIKQAIKANIIPPKKSNSFLTLKN